MIEVACLSGGGIDPYLDVLADLRIRVFREFPYLYEGSAAYEREYLASYADCPESVIMLAITGGRIAGASTGLPLIAADPAFRRPFEKAGMMVGGIFYFGESVLEPSERGQGIGHRFFDEREKHAARLGFHTAAFCAVSRDENHPLRPPDYRGHDSFWSGRGYRKRPDLVAEMNWKQVDGNAEVSNRLDFWLRDL